MTLPKGRVLRPRRAPITISSATAFTQLVCAVALGMHSRATWVGDGEFIIRTNRAELEALRFSAQCAKAFSEKE